MSFHTPNEFRVRDGAFGTTDKAASYGAFQLPYRGGGRVLSVLNVIACAEGGWEHVSVSVMDQPRCPTWYEMDHVKGMFWDDEDCVAQLHVPRSQWVNCHPFTLHLWRQQGAEWAQPPAWMVGPTKG